MKQTPEDKPKRRGRPAKVKVENERPLNDGPLTPPEALTAAEMIEPADLTEHLTTDEDKIREQFRAVGEEYLKDQAAEDRKRAADFQIPANANITARTLSDDEAAAAEAAAVDSDGTEYERLTPDEGDALEAAMAEVEARDAATQYRFDYVGDECRPNVQSTKDIPGLAVLLKNSQWFPNLSVDQLATVMFLGDTIGLAPVQAAFDLEVVFEKDKNRPRVKWVDEPIDWTRQRGGSVPPAEYAEKWKGFNDRLKASIKAADDERVAYMPEKPSRDQETGQTDPIIEDRTAEFEIFGPEYPPPVVEIIEILDPVPGSPVDNAAEDVSRSDNAEDDGGSELVLTDGDDAIETIGPIDTPAVADQAADEATLALTWRTQIGRICDDLNIPKAEKLSTFDASKFDAKREQFEKASSYYLKKTNEVRELVILCLETEFNLTDPESRAGFYLFADVNANPYAWDWPEAKKAEAALIAFRGDPSIPAA